MLFGIGMIRKEIEQQGQAVNQRLYEVKENIPYQSQLEKDYNKLLDSSVQLKKQIEELSNDLLSVQKMNEKLLDYIENIEEVKESGGIEVQEYKDYDPYKIGVLDRKVITIPSIKITKTIGRYE